MNFERADALNRVIRQIGMRHRSLAAAELAPLGLYLGQEVFLLELDAQGPRTQVELAKGLGCEPPSVTIMARKLEAGGLIARRPSPDDRRATIVELTDQGRQLMPRLKEAWQRLAEATVAGLESTSLDCLMNVATDLSQSLDERTGCRDR